MANSSFPGSRALAEYYCHARKIPTDHIICFAMPDGELVARSLYEKSVVPQVRQALARMPHRRTIRCLVTIHGVPLRISPAQPTEQQRKLITTLRNNRKLALDELEDLLAQAYRLASLPDPPPTDLAEQSSANRGAGLVKRTLDAVNKVAAKVDSLPESSYKQGVLADFLKLQQDITGWAGRIELLKAQGPLDPSDPRSTELAQLQQQLSQANQQIPQLMRPDITFDQLDQAAGIARRSRGVLGLVLQLDASVAFINYPFQDSGSSFDSELSLVLADDYPVRGPTMNSLCLDYPPAREKKIPTLMVSRIDAPTASIAQGLIDRALRTEREGLKGTFYIDAGWTKARWPGYKRMEDSLLATARIVTEHTSIPVVLDKDKTVFPEGSCPSAALYCGWYSLRRYVDAFDWTPGAVGYHVASFELTTLRDPAYNGWATAMLRDGITATLGSVDEPRLVSFPSPDQFFTLLLTGRFALVECFYMTKPFNSWQLVLIGDPLYTPFARTPGLTAAQAEKLLEQKLPFRQ